MMKKVMKAVINGMQIVNIYVKSLKKMAKYTHNMVINKSKIKAK